MEDMRKRLIAEGDPRGLFRAAGSKDAIKNKARPSQRDTPVVVSSAESSPAFTKKREDPPIQILDSSDEESDARSDDSEPVVRQAARARRVIASDSDSEDDDDDSKGTQDSNGNRGDDDVYELYDSDDLPAVIPPPKPAASKPPQARVPSGSKPPHQVSSIADAQAYSSVPFRPVKNVLDTSHTTATHKPAPAQPLKDAPTWETFDLPDTHHLYDPAGAAADAEKALKDLVSESMNDTTEEIDYSLAVVRGFREGIKLLPHQIVGRTWMGERESGKKTGGILADDMGLGKTIQTLTRIVDNRPRTEDKEAGYAAATLVVCPVALVGQWASEIQKMAIGLRVVEHHGASRTTDPKVLSKAHVVITSYSIVSSEHATYTGEVKGAKAKAKPKPKKSKEDDWIVTDSDSSVERFGRTIGKKTGRGKKKMDALFQVQWWRIVLDEAHNIKNRKTKAAIACCALDGKYRWCLTGTPLQNNVEELFSLLQFLRIRPLNDWDEFNHKINKPVKSGRSKTAMSRLQVVLKAIMLRRRKDALLDGKPLIELPSREVNVLVCEFDAEERLFYQALAEKIESVLNKFIKSGDISKNFTSVLVLLLRMRQACNHPSLISADYTVDRDAVEPKAVQKGNDIDDVDDLADMVKGMGVSAGAKCQLCQVPLTGSNTTQASTTHCKDCSGLADKARRKSLAVNSGLPPDSTKIRKIIELLETIDEESDGDDKTIIFSQFTTMLDIIEPFLKHERIKYCRYDGSMRKDKRETSIEQIKNDKATKCILISFKAGSTGLNLTACNRVILVDMWWNPALEEQAFDRAHRFGQTKPVSIYKLTIKDTVEERILQLQETKRQLAAAALSGDKVKNSGSLRLEELMALFKHDG